MRGLLGAAERAQAIPNFPDYLELVLDQHVVQMVSCNFMFGGCNMMGFYSEDPPHRDKRDLWLAVTRAKMAGARGGVGGVRTGSTQSESLQCVCVCVCSQAHSDLGIFQSNGTSQTQQANLYCREHELNDH